MELSKTTISGGTNMLYNYSTTNLIGLQDLEIKKVNSIGDTTYIDAEMKRKPHHCPCCNHITDKVHDYRIQNIKDIPAFGKYVVIALRKRRYVCKNCGKRFYENTDFLPKYYRMTNRLSAWVIHLLEDVRSFTSVAKEVNLSVSTIIRIFDYVGYSNPQHPPEVLAIDEFKGNTGDEKYQCILTDPQNGIVLDILPARNTEYLIKYFKHWDVGDRLSVKCFVSDMWQQYTDLSKIFFKNSILIIDKYHFIRQMVWAFEAVRKSEQKKYGKQNRLCFKNSKRILTKRAEKLTDYQKERINSILYLSDKLRTAYQLKEMFYQIVDTKDRKHARNLMLEWIYAAQSSGLGDYMKCAKTLINWQNGILSSFEHPYTNGFTEGCNNKIKVLKRNAYGYRNFKRFRNRILHIFNHKKAALNKENETA